MGALLTAPVTAMIVERSASPWCTAAVATMQGWRRTYEDQHIFESFIGDNVAIFAVLDGHGGSMAASLSREILSEALVRLSTSGALESEATASEGLKRAFVEADAELRRRLRSGDNSGTTVVAAVIVRTEPAPGCPQEYLVHLANAGDSRAVLSQGGRLLATEDHKPHRPDETERILAAGGSVERGPLGGPMRVDGSLAVSRAFGDFAFKPVHKPAATCKISPLPEVMTVRCRVGDWILIACDGIFDVFSNTEVREFIVSRACLESDGGEAVVDLLRACLERGSKDNCTNLFVQLKNSSTPYARTVDVLRGDFSTSSNEIQAKYLEFFEQMGCSLDEAGTSLQKLRLNQPVGLAAAVVAPGPAGSTPQADPQPKMGPLQKALRAMKSLRRNSGVGDRSSTSRPSVRSDAGG